MVVQYYVGKAIDSETRPVLKYFDSNKKIYSTTRIKMAKKRQTVHALRIECPGAYRDGWKSIVGMGHKRGLGRGFGAGVGKRLRQASRWVNISPR